MTHAPVASRRVGRRDKLDPARQHEWEAWQAVAGWQAIGAAATVASRLAGSASCSLPGVGGSCVHWHVPSWL